MINRRRVMQGGLAALGSVSVAAPFDAMAQGKAPVKVRYNEVVRSVLYAPSYVALSKGYFKEAGLDITMTTAFGGDKSTAALLSNTADIALIGPETAIYVLEGTAEFRHGANLEHLDRVEAGDFIYLPAGVPHQPFNPTDRAAKALIARTDPNEQESVVLLK